MQLEKYGLTPDMATYAMENDRVLRAMVQVASGFRPWYESICGWFASLGYRISVPNPMIPTHAFVARTLDGFIPFYMPPSEELRLSELLRQLDLHVAIGSWVNALDDVLEFHETGYWFWMKSTLLELPVVDETILFHTASLEEVLIAHAVGKALSWRCSGPSVDERVIQVLRSRRVSTASILAIERIDRRVDLGHETIRCQAFSLADLERQIRLQRAPHPHFRLVGRIPSVLESVPQ